MKEYQIEVLTQILQQYKNLTMNSEKLFYYAYAKFNVQLKGILKNNEFLDKKNEEQIIDFICNATDMKCILTYDELKDFLSMKRADKSTLKGVIEPLIGSENESENEIENEIEKQIEKENIIKIVDENGVKRRFSIYIDYSFDGSKRILEVTFNKKVIEMFLLIPNGEYKSLGGYSTINTNDLKYLNSTYELKLYLYAISIIHGNSGIVTRTIEDLRSILAENKKLHNDNFVSRYIKKPCELINRNNDLSITVYMTRSNDNITLKVHKKN